MASVLYHTYSPALNLQVKTLTCYIHINIILFLTIKAVRSFNCYFTLQYTDIFFSQATTEKQGSVLHKALAEDEALAI